MSKQLQKYYEVPDFLPVVAESLQIEWIFIGSGGKGADMHVRYILFMGNRLNAFSFLVPLSMVFFVDVLFII